MVSDLQSACEVSDPILRFLYWRQPYACVLVCPVRLKPHVALARSRGHVDRLSEDLGNASPSSKGSHVPENPVLAQIADMIVERTRDMVESEPGAEEELGGFIAELGLDPQALVGVFGTLVNRVAVATMQAKMLAAMGTEVDPTLLTPGGGSTVVRFIDMRTHLMLTRSEFGRESPEFTVALHETFAAYQALTLSPDDARFGVLTLGMQLILHERLRGLDLSTVVE